MIDDQLVPAALTACAVVACAVAKTPAPVAVPLTCSSLLREPMTSNEMTIRETTQPTISGHLVGVSNIWERELPDDKGAIAPRLSANLTIRDLASEQKRVEKVFAGRVISLGTDRYCVVNVEEGKSAPGTITLRKLSPE